MRHFVVFALLAALLLSGGTVLKAQSLQATMERISMTAAKAYVEPIVSGIGSSMNGGWFHRAPAGEIFGVNLEIGVVAMGTYYKEENKTFDVTGEFQFSITEAKDLVRNSYPTAPSIVVDNVAQQLASEKFNLRIKGPTVIGSKNDHVQIEMPARTYSVPGYGSYTFAGNQSLPGVTGQDLSAKMSFLPLLAPQVSVGTLLGTQATFRYLPKYPMGEIGDAKYFGFGIQHNPTVWLGSLLPLDIALAYYSQKLTVGDLPLFEAKTTAYGINVSKQLGLGFLNFTPYAGFMLESSTLSFKYNFQTALAGQQISQQITFDLEGQNKSRIVLGASIRLLIINVNVDYNIGTYNSITAGAMFII